MSLWLGHYWCGQALGSVGTQKVILFASLAVVLEDFESLAESIVGIYPWHALVCVLLEIVGWFTALAFESGVFGQVIERVGHLQVNPIESHVNVIQITIGVEVPGHTRIQRVQVAVLVFLLCFVHQEVLVSGCEVFALFANQLAI